MRVLDSVKECERVVESKREQERERGRKREGGSSVGGGGYSKGYTRWILRFIFSI